MRFQLKSKGCLISFESLFNLCELSIRFMSALLAAPRVLSAERKGTLIGGFFSLSALGKAYLSVGVAL